METTNGPTPTERVSRFAIPEADLNSSRVTHAEMVQEVSDPHRMPLGWDATTGTGDCVADGDGE